MLFVIELVELRSLRSSPCLRPFSPNFFQSFDSLDFDGKSGTSY